MKFNNATRISLLLLRITLGVTMAIHGSVKFLDLKETNEFFVTLGLPAFMAIVIALIEVGGGLFMILGILVPWVSLGFIVILVSAIIMLKTKSGFIGGYELELLLIVMSIVCGCSHFNKKIIQFMPQV